jgi:hypothetical protein
MSGLWREKGIAAHFSSKGKRPERLAARMTKGTNRTLAHHRNGFFYPACRCSVFAARALCSRVCALRSKRDQLCAAPCKPSKRYQLTGDAQLAVGWGSGRVSSFRSVWLGLFKSVWLVLVQKCMVRIDEPVMSSDLSSMLCKAVHGWRAILAVLWCDALRSSTRAKHDASGLPAGSWIYASLR